MTGVTRGDGTEGGEEGKGEGGKEEKKKENCREQDGRDLRLYERSSRT